MKHPLSTIFNFTYLAAGIIGLIVAINNAVVFQAFAALVVVGLAIASTGYHWTETRHWQRADIIAIYGTFFIAMAWQLSTMETFSGYQWLLVVVFSGLTLAMAFTYDRWTQTQIGLLAIINLVFLWPRAGLWIFVLTSILFLGGLAIGQWAEQYPKDTHDYDWRHALWKIPTAAGILLLILEY